MNPTSKRFVYLYSRGPQYNISYHELNRYCKKSEICIGILKAHDINVYTITHTFKNANQKWPILYLSVMPYHTHKMEQMTYWTDYIKDLGGEDLDKESFMKCLRMSKSKDEQSKKLALDILYRSNLKDNIDVMVEELINEH